MRTTEGMETMIERLKYYDWSFSSTAEYAVGALLVIAMVMTTLA
jgi:hypothetical protein